MKLVALLTAISTSLALAGCSGESPVAVDENGDGMATSEGQLASVTPEFVDTYESRAKQTPTSACAAVFCSPNTKCVEQSGKALCVPIETSACATIFCAPSTKCIEQSGVASCVSIETR